MPAKTPKKAAPKKKPAAAEVPGYGINWKAWFEFSPEGWFEDRAKVHALVDAIAKTAWWNQFEYMGLAKKVGTPRGSIDAVKKAIATGERAFVTFARGSARAALYIDETDAWLQLRITEEHLNITAGASGDALAKMGPAILGDTTEMLLRLRRAWKGNATLTEGVAFPTAEADFDYPHVEPRRTSSWPLGAILEIVDPAIDEHRKVAKAKAPKGVIRTETDGVVVLRWVDDPVDITEVRAAAAKHEAWIVDLIPTEELDESW